MPAPKPNHSPLQILYDDYAKNRSETLELTLNKESIKSWPKFESVLLQEFGFQKKNGSFGIYIPSNLNVEL